MTVSFVHLRLHTEYSLVDGLVRVKPLIKAVAAAGMPAVAVTDMSNMCALVKFYKAAMGGGIKPLCGADLWLAGRGEDAPLSRLTLLAMDAAGYRNLTELVSRGWTEGQHNGLVIIQRDWVKAAAAGQLAGAGKAVTPEEMELSRLRAENLRLRRELEIIKKAAAYFAKDAL